MKIDRAVLAWDGNPLYAGFFEMHQQIWGKAGIKVGLAYVSNGSNAAAIPKTGDVVVLEDKSKAPFTPPPGRNWKATMGLIHGPRLFPGEVTIVMNMDQFPASNQLIEAVERVPDDEMATAFCPISHICTTEIIAHYDTWERIMAPAPLDFTELIEWTWAQNLDVSGYGNIAVGWGNDEVLLSKLANECEGLKVTPLFSSDHWLPRILGITQVTPDPAKLRAGYYTNLHVRQPIRTQDQATFNTLMSLDKLP